MVESVADASCYDTGLPRNYLAAGCTAAMVCYWLLVRNLRSARFQPGNQLL
jgi:hypothetical protein